MICAHGTNNDTCALCERVPRIATAPVWEHSADDLRALAAREAGTLPLSDERPLDVTIYNKGTDPHAGDGIGECVKVTGGTVALLPSDERALDAADADPWALLVEARAQRDDLKRRIDEAAFNCPSCGRGKYRAERDEAERLLLAMVRAWGGESMHEDQSARAAANAYLLRRGVLTTDVT